MNSELHLFIIWEKGRIKQEDILNDIMANFKIKEIIEMKWNKEIFSQNLSRFYGTLLPKGSGKEARVGNGEFLLIIVEDNNPIYDTRLTSKGNKIVNVNMFDRKEKYRSITGNDDKIHATNDQNETNHDLTLLLGKNIKDYLKSNNGYSNEIHELERDLIGTNEWNSVIQMFYALNNCTNYAILRNYESLPDEIYNNDHNDIDIICDSLEDVAYVLNATPVFKEKYRVHYKTNVENRIAYFDIRHVGDNYYYENMERKLLKEKIYNEKGFYTLNNEDYFYSLIYHALIHKPIFKEDYKETLERLQIEKVNKETTIEEYALILRKWMIKKEYIIVIPEDKTVQLNPWNVLLFKPLIYRDDNNLQYINQLEEEVTKLRKENQQLTIKLEGILDSRSWKITKMLRILNKKNKSNMN